VQDVDCDREARPNERLLTDKNRMPKKSNRIRRNSAPLLSMPEGFLIEISENSKGRRHDRSKSVRCTKSVMKKSKRCTKSPNVSKRSSNLMNFLFPVHCLIQNLPSLQTPWGTG
jgi:hypothetical protein